MYISISSAEADRKIGGRGVKNSLRALSSRTLFKISLAEHSLKTFLENSRQELSGELSSRTLSMNSVGELSGRTLFKNSLGNPFQERCLRDLWKNSPKTLFKNPLQELSLKTLFKNFL